MALEGSLRDFGIEAVFQLINSGKKTGTLHAVGKDGTGEAFVYFRGGKIFGAVSNVNRVPIGERLVSAGYMTEEQLAHVLELQRISKPRRKLGQILVGEGLITRAILKTAIREQIQNIVFDLLPWTDGEFHFYDDQLPAAEDVGLLVSADLIFSKGGQKLDEWERVRRQVPSTGTIFRAATHAAKGVTGTLTAKHRQLLELIDGRRTVTQLAAMDKLSEFDTSSLLYDLATAGIIEALSDQEAGRLAEAAEDEFVVRGLEPAGAKMTGDRAGFFDELVSLTDAERFAARLKHQLSARRTVVAEVRLDRSLTPQTLAAISRFIKEQVAG